MYLHAFVKSNKPAEVVQSGNGFSEYCLMESVRTFESQFNAIYKTNYT